MASSVPICEELGINTFMWTLLTEVGPNRMGECRQLGKIVFTPLSEIRLSLLPVFLKFWLDNCFKATHILNFMKIERFSS
jgi:hypothetical protein